MDDNQSVGLFWIVLIEGKLEILQHKCGPTQAEVYGDFATCPHGHYDIWENWRVGEGLVGPAGRMVFSTYEYEEWPRGRVVFDLIKSRFVVYADDKVLRSRLRPFVLRAFGIPDDQVDFRRDEHYQCTKKLIPKQ